jgi:hypothetical protein
MLPDRKIVKEARFVREEGELAFRPDRIGSEVASSDPNRAAAGWDDTGQASQGGRLAGPVWANQPENLARSYREGKLPDCGEVAVPLRKSLCLNHAGGEYAQAVAGGKPDGIIV